MSVSSNDNSTRSSSAHDDALDAEQFRARMEAFLEGDETYDIHHDDLDPEDAFLYQVMLSMGLAEMRERDAPDPYLEQAQEWHEEAVAAIPPLEAAMDDHAAPPTRLTIGESPSWLGLLAALLRPPFIREPAPLATAAWGIGFLLVIIQGVGAIYGAKYVVFRPLYVGAMALFAFALGAGVTRALQRRARRAGGGADG